MLDPVWYRQTYHDLRDTPIDVARHYLEHGAAEGRNPHPLFDTNFYLEQNPNVAASGMNPLVHYILYGAHEGRNPHSLFDVARYVARHPDIDIKAVNPLQHCIQNYSSLEWDSHSSKPSEGALIASLTLAAERGFREERQPDPDTREVVLLLVDPQIPFRIFPEPMRCEELIRTKAW